MGKRRRPHLSTYSDARRKRKNSSAAPEYENKGCVESSDTVSISAVTEAQSASSSENQSRNTLLAPYHDAERELSSVVASQPNDLAPTCSTAYHHQVENAPTRVLNTCDMDEITRRHDVSSQQLPQPATSEKNRADNPKSDYEFKSYMYDPSQFLDSESEQDTDGVIPTVSIKKSDIGSLFQQKMCDDCRALKWPKESPGFCCGKGKHKGVDVQEPPQEWMQLYKSSSEFRKDLRIYNNSFALSSIACEEIGMGGYTPMLKICGKIYHKIGSLMPSTGETPRFAQLYFYDPDNELQNRMNLSGGRFQLNRQILKTLQTILDKVNPYVHQIKAARNLRPEAQECVLRLTQQPGRDKTYCSPSSSEIAGVQPHNDGAMLQVVFERNGDLKFVNELCGLYDPLHYVIMFPYGDEGFDLSKKLHREQGEKGLTIGKFYRYRLQVRDPSKTFNIVLRCRRVTQQYVIDQFLKDDNSKMRYLQAPENQNKFRVATFAAIADATSEDLNEPGQRIILPASHTGSPRWYHKAYLDMMSIVRKLGKPDLFVTFTCNPEWPEIKNSLFENERPEDRPDIMVRVFHLKLLQFIDVLTKQQVFGRVIAYTMVKEDQKRGLPHAHLLLILHEKDKPRTSSAVDRIICAEIPDKHSQPELFEVIRRFNIHGPCKPGDPCHHDGKTCNKGFPKPFNNGPTTFDGNYYPTYKRRDIGHGGNALSEGTIRQVSNAYVVPYSPSLSTAFNAHINVECVHSVGAVKYLYKYITKGTDKTTFTIEPASNQKTVINEIQRFQDGRYVTAGEALWRLFEFPTVMKKPTVTQLQIHLDDEQSVIFRDGEAEQAAQKGPPTTQLLAYFDLNKKDTEANDVLYPDIVRHYRWKQCDKAWIKRTRKVSHGRSDDEELSDEIGRIPSFHLNPRKSELFFLRVLLYNVKGAKSFEDLRRVGTALYPTFREACLHRGLLEDDDAIAKALEEGCEIRFGRALRELFVTLLIFGEPKNPKELWNRFKNHFADDFKRKRNSDIIGESDISKALLEIERHLQTFNSNLSEFDIECPYAETLNDLYEEIDYDVDSLTKIYNFSIDLLTQDQKFAYEEILQSVESKSGKFFVLDAPAGSGKTFLITTVLAKIRSMKQIALATAISGIAAVLLPGGKTAHSQLKIPIELTETSCCVISPRERLAECLRNCRLLVIDEFTMAHKHLYEAVDRSLRDITEVNSPFGGITVLLSGDWRQILPVVVRGNDADVVDASLKRSALWQYAQSLKLTGNKRLKAADTTEGAEFLEYQLAVGEGRIKADREGCIPIPEGLRLEKNDLDGLCKFVFPNFSENYKNPTWLCSRGILCPTNDIVHKVNDRMLEKVPGEGIELLSCDHITDTDQPDDYPIEFANTLNPSGMPPHILKLKPGAPVMLLRNLDPRSGHCNGSRYVVTKIGNHVIDCTVAFGPHVGEKKLIPRIKLRSKGKHMPFTLERLQFPLRLCFGMTINKAQGQSLERLGLFLEHDVFSHGQLYVGLSRAKDPRQIKIVRPADNTKMVNVVYPQIFQN